MWHFANGKSDRHDEVKRLMGAVSREKKFAKPLDKLPQVWYNKGVKRRRKAWKSLSQKVKNLLTNPLKCCIINTSKGRKTHQTRKELIL